MNFAQCKVFDKLITKTQSAHKRQPVQQKLQDTSTTVCIFTAAFVHRAPNKAAVRGGGHHQVNNMDPLYSHSTHTCTLSVLQVNCRGGVCGCGSQVARCIPSTGSLWQPAQIPLPLRHSSRLSLHPPIPQPAGSRVAVTWELPAPRECTQEGREMERKRKALRGRAREGLSNRGEKC